MKTIIASTMPHKFYTCISHRGIDWRIRALLALRMMAYPDEPRNRMQACASRACMFATGGR